MKIITVKLIAIAVILAAGFNANAQMTGKEIVEKAYNLPTGEDVTSKLTMTLINKSGQTRVRKIQQYSKNFSDVEKSIMFFMTPADVKNTSFMN